MVGKSINFRVRDLDSDLVPLLLLSLTEIANLLAQIYALPWHNGSGCPVKDYISQTLLH